MIENVVTIYLKHHDAGGYRDLRAVVYAALTKQLAGKNAAEKKRHLLMLSVLRFLIDIPVGDHFYLVIDQEQATADEVIILLSNPRQAGARCVRGRAQGRGVVWSRRRRVQGGRCGNGRLRRRAALRARRAHGESEGHRRGTSTGSSWLEEQPRYTRPLA